MPNGSVIVPSIAKENFMKQPPGTGRRVSPLKEIARTAGVSPATASKVLNHYPAISDPTRQRVWEAVRTVGRPPRRYRSADTAGNTARTVLLLPMANSLFRELEREPTRLTSQAFHSFQQALVGGGYDLLLGPGGLSDAEAVAHINNGIGKRFGGIALLPPLGETLPQFLHHRRIPTVCISGSVGEPLVPVVTADQSEGTRLLVRHLIDLGHRRIGYVGSGLRSRSHLDRLAGFLLEMQLAKLPSRRKWILQPSPPDRIRLADRSVERWHDAIERFLTRRIDGDDLPTALVCVNDDFARKLIDLLAVRQLRVPEDVSVTGWGSEVATGLTSIDARPAQVGEMAARWIIGQMTARDSMPARMLVPVRLCIGRTTAPPRTAVNDQRSKLSPSPRRNRR